MSSLFLAWCFVATASPNELCPAAQAVPKLRLGEVANPAITTAEPWQVLWGNIALSDAQLAELSNDPKLIERTREELEDRGFWVYLGLGVAAVGAATSSTGWVLYGQDELAQTITLPLAIGGLLVGMFGVLMVAERIQTPLEPHLAPTPKHRLTKSEAAALIETINRAMIGELCPSGETPTP